MYDDKKTDQIPVQIPQTLEELQTFVIMHEIPLEKLHMHLGENYSEPKAYGIYQEGSDFIVYKNKADGSRAIRYRGADEAHAVNEIYLKIREMGIAAKTAQAGVSRSSDSSFDAGDYSNDLNSSGEDTKNPSRFFSILKKSLLSREGLIVFVILLLALPSIIKELSPTRRTPKYQEGYYSYLDAYYYSDGYDWYILFDNIWSYISYAPVDEIMADYNAYSVDIYEEGITPCTISSDNDKSDRSDRWDDDDWADDNDWDFDFDSDWDWDSDW